MLNSRDKKSRVELMPHNTAFNLIHLPYSSPYANTGSRLAWAESYTLNEVNTLTQSGTAVTASGGTPFTSTDVPQTDGTNTFILYETGMIAKITVYTDPTHVTVDRSQTVAAGTKWKKVRSIGGDGLSNAFTIVGVVKATRQVALLNSPLFGYRSAPVSYALFNDYVEANFDSHKNGYDQYCMFSGSSSLSTVGMGTGRPFVAANKSNQEWAFVALVINANSVKLFVNGSCYESNPTNPGVIGCNCIGIPFHLASQPGSGTDMVYWDFITNGTLWSSCQAALLQIWNTALTNQDLLDLYGMIMFGRGYCISRQYLAGMWLGRRESGNLAAYSSHDAARATIYDQSGRSRNAKLFLPSSHSLAWTDSIVNLSSPIYIPRVWDDDNLLNRVTVNTVGAPTVV